MNLINNALLAKSPKCGLPDISEVVASLLPCKLVDICKEVDLLISPVKRASFELLDFQKWLRANC